MSSPVLPQALSLVDQVRNHYIRRIVDGAIKPGEPVESVRQIAREAQVSHATAASAIRSLAEDGWLVTQVGSGARVAYSPPLHLAPPVFTDSTAKALRRLHFLSCVEPDNYPSRYDFQVLCGVQEAAEVQGWHVRMGLLQEEDAVRAAVGDEASAGIVIGSNHGVDAKRLAGCRAPIIYFGMSSDSIGFAAVSIDNYEGGRQAAAHLLKLGHRRLRFVTVWAEPSAHAETRHFALRYQGFSSCLAEAGLPVPPQLPWHIGEADAVFAIRELLAGVSDAHPDAPTALVVGNDVMAGEVLAIALEMGIQVPRQLSIVGFENRPLSFPNLPAITTLDFPKRAMGREIVDLLVSAPARRDVWPVCITLPMRLLDRDTTAPCSS